MNSPWSTGGFMFRLENIIIGWCSSLWLVVSVQDQFSYSSMLWSLRCDNNKDSPEGEELRAAALGLVVMFTLFNISSFLQLHKKGICCLTLFFSRPACFLKHPSPWWRQMWIVLWSSGYSSSSREGRFSSVPVWSNQPTSYQINHSLQQDTASLETGPTLPDKNKWAGWKWSVCHTVETPRCTGASRAFGKCYPRSHEHEMGRTI